MGASAPSARSSTETRRRRTRCRPTASRLSISSASAPMRAELAAAPPVLAGALVLLLFAGCGEGGSPTSVVGRYETAIFSRDGDKLCATFAPKLREVLAEQASEQAGPGSTSR